MELFESSTCDYRWATLAFGTGANVSLILVPAVVVASRASTNPCVGLIKPLNLGGLLMGLSGTPEGRLPFQKDVWLTLFLFSFRLPLFYLDTFILNICTCAA